MKKMRRLIPAIAMLLVSAVMLSTASFAWFTMNSQVEATGMQIQAEASSSLVIGNAPLTTSNGAPKVYFESTNVNKLIPMTYNAGANGNIQGAQLKTADVVTGFVAPNSTSNVNVQTGIYTDNDFAAADYYIEEELYVASAGEAIDEATLQFELSAPSVDMATNGAFKAYAAAIYVISDSSDSAWGENGVLDDDVPPHAIIFVDTDDNRFKCTVSDINIPSVIGAGEGGNPAVGVKIIVRFYVDGELKSLTNKVNVDAGYVYTSATTYQGDRYFKPTFTEVTVADGVTTAPFGWYTKDDTTGVYTKVNLGATLVAGTKYYEVTGVSEVILTADQQVTGVALPANSYTRAMGQDKAEYTFVRSALVPSSGTELSLKITKVGE